MKKLLLLLLSHAVVGVMGFATGIYLLPILTAPAAPSDAEILSMTSNAEFKARFRRDLTDSDALHWGEGDVSVARDLITLQGKLAPGPDYKLYLSPEFVETEDGFSKLRNKMVRVGDVRTFENFVVKVPKSIDPAQYNTVIIWCEAFAQFITAAQYR